MPHNGTSPRVWGEPKDVSSKLGSFRNIPTRVGRTSCCSIIIVILSEHPHACGENATRSLAPMLGSGTSPRMWGERGRVGPRSRQGRNIPTHVGRTCSPDPKNLCAPEHPHACGENLLDCKSSFRAAGTSPRMWGEQTSDYKHYPPSRNIPTHVGRTASDRRWPTCSTEHPHACGENKGG